ncbi:MAG: hypothetical protein V8Q42_09010 [Anaerovoracaceae bacterium]
MQIRRWRILSGEDFKGKMMILHMAGSFDDTSRSERGGGIPMKQLHQLQSDLPSERKRQEEKRW